jgi:hypothetical protein
VKERAKKRSEESRRETNGRTTAYHVKPETGRQTTGPGEKSGLVPGLIASCHDNQSGVCAQCACGEEERDEERKQKREGGREKEKERGEREREYIGGGVEEGAIADAVCEEACVINSATCVRKEEAKMWKRGRR